MVRLLFMLCFTSVWVRIISLTFNLKFLSRYRTARLVSRHSSPSKRVTLDLSAPTVFVVLWLSIDEKNHIWGSNVMEMLYKNVKKNASKRYKPVSHNNCQCSFSFWLCLSVLHRCPSSLPHLSHTDTHRRETPWGALPLWATPTAFHARVRIDA